jgi:hypothetical protein
MNKDLTTKQLFTELLIRLENKEIYLPITERTKNEQTNESLYLVATGSLPKSQ